MMLLRVACDPGIGYSPKNWTKIDEHHFSKNFGLFELEINPLNGLIGSSYLMPEVTIHNHAKSSIVIMNAVLKANNFEYIASPFGQENREIIPPNQTRKITLIFELNKSLYKVLKDPVELNIKIKVENDQIELNIPMVKTFG